MANGFIVGCIKDLNKAPPPTFKSTTARVEIWTSSGKYRTLYPPSKAQGDEFWYYSTSLAPNITYTVKAFDTSVGQAYKPINALFQSGGAFVADFLVGGKKTTVAERDRNVGEAVDHVRWLLKVLARFLSRRVDAVIELDE